MVLFVYFVSIVFVNYMLMVLNQKLYLCINRKWHIFGAILFYGAMLFPAFFFSSWRDYHIIFVIKPFFHTRSECLMAEPLTKLRTDQCY